MKNGDSRNQNEVAVSSLLEEGLETLSLETSPRQRQQLVDLVFLLDHWAARINLTGHRDPLAVTKHLVLDAAALSISLTEIAGATSLTDLGTGAGFPGLPLAILHPHLTVSLVDSRLKRNHFQREVRRRLGLDHVQPILGRAEELEPDASDIVIAQAMAQPTQALELMARWARPGSTLVLPASENAREPETPAGIHALELREYAVPGSHTHRKLWIAKIKKVQPDEV